MGALLVWHNIYLISQPYSIYTNNYEIATNGLRCYCRYYIRRLRSTLLYDWQSVCLGIEHPCGTCDQILLPSGTLVSEICGRVSLGRFLWRENGSAIRSVITQWSESRTTCNHTLLSHLRLSEPGGLGSRIYISQEHGGPLALGCR
jgi:hypothetical protein